MSHRTPAALVLVLMAALALALPFSARPAVVSGTTVTTDFSEFFAGTIVGNVTGASDDALIQRYAGGAGVVPTGMGFELNVDHLTGGGTTDSAVLYDTDRRQYTAASDGSGPAINTYASVNGIKPGSEGAAVAGEDDDIEYDTTTGWNGGNLENTRVGNMLIIQENISGTERNQGHLTFVQGQDSGSSHAPDDEAGGGTFTFTFETYLQSFEFDWVDLDEANGNSVSIRLRDTATGNFATINFGEFISASSPFFQSGVGWGDGYANSIDPITVADIAAANEADLVFNTAGEVKGGLTSLVSDFSATKPIQFNEVQFFVNGSGGISFIGYTLIPEGSTVFAGLAPMAWALFRRYRGRR